MHTYIHKYTLIMDGTSQRLDKLNKGHKPRVERTCASSSKKLTIFTMNHTYKLTCFYTSALLRFICVFFLHICLCKISMKSHQIIGCKQKVQILAPGNRYASIIGVHTCIYKKIHMYILYNINT